MYNIKFVPLFFWGFLEFLGGLLGMSFFLEASRNCWSFGLSIFFLSSLSLEVKLWASWPLEDCVRLVELYVEDRLGVREADEGGAEAEATAGAKTEAEDEAEEKLTTLEA